MNLTNLRSLARLAVRKAKISAITVANLDLFLNRGTLDVATRILMLKNEETFDSVADQLKYSLSASLTRYISMEEGALWWNDGSQWQRLEPKTVAYLNEWHPNWRDDASGRPQRYAIEGDNLYVHPAPDANGTDVFRAYFSQKPPIMTDAAHFPFSMVDPPITEIDQFDDLGEAVIMYFEWKGLPALGSVAEGFTKRQEYLAEIKAKKISIQNRADIVNSKYTQYGRIARGRIGGDAHS